ncbi:unnamed protein product [Coregonus sp. 'balchen']|nr:unnamed protein product [Coregonus sp. 'balchen']
MTARWPLVVFYNILDVSAYNSFVLWSEIKPAWNQGKYNKRRLFMEELGRQLVIPHIKRRKVIPRTSAAVKWLRNPAGLLQLYLCSSSPSPSSLMPTSLPRPLPKGVGANSALAEVISNIQNVPKCNAYICKDHAITTCLACKLRAHSD